MPMTRIARLHAFGGPEHLRVEDLASSRVARTFPLDEIVDAYRFVLTNEQMGTVMVECS